ncbi:unnamed protein product [Victoria cruziana]
MVHQQGTRVRRREWSFSKREKQTSTGRLKLESLTLSRPPPLPLSLISGSTSSLYVLLLQLRKAGRFPLLFIVFHRNLLGFLLHNLAGASIISSLPEQVSRRRRPCNCPRFEASAASPPPYPLDRLTPSRHEMSLGEFYP